ncbi:MAG: lipoyl(octanoyl) transferase LipB [Planctomycetota bacterium]
MTERELEVRWLGRRPYLEVHRLQQELLTERIEGRIGDTLLLVEHDEVVTLGRRSGEDDAAGVDLPIVRVERGGEATWHGPGQLVAYPIRLLEEGQRDLHKYLRDLEQVVIDVLADFGVEAHRQPPNTGVWVGARKIASLGVAVRRWVTWHGVALNLDSRPDAFTTFRPCGLDAGVMTRLADCAARDWTWDTVGKTFCIRFAERFGYETVQKRA